MSLQEAKSRVWHNFWDSLLLTECDEEVAERLLELQDAVAKFGAHRVRDHFRGQQDPAVARLRQWVQEELEGQDVYWDGVPHDGKLDDNTCFGKMYVVPYPFTCVFVWDASDDYAFITYDDFVTMAQKNQQPDVVAKRTLRQKLRALHGEQVHLEMTRTESHSVPDGMEETTNAEGKTTRKQRYTTVQVEMHYHRCVRGVDGATITQAADARSLTRGCAPSPALLRRLRASAVSLRSAPTQAGPWPPASSAPSTTTMATVWPRRHTPGNSTRSATRAPSATARLG